MIITLRLGPAGSKMPTEEVERRIRRLLDSDIPSKPFLVEKVTVLEETPKIEA